MEELNIHLEKKEEVGNQSDISGRINQHANKYLCSINPSVSQWSPSSVVKYYVMTFSSNVSIKSTAAAVFFQTILIIVFLH